MVSRELQRRFPRQKHCGSRHWTRFELSQPKYRSLGTRKDSLWLNSLQLTGATHPA